MRQHYDLEPMNVFLIIAAVTLAFIPRLLRVYREYKALQSINREDVAEVRISKVEIVIKKYKKALTNSTNNSFDKVS